MSSTNSSSETWSFVLENEYELEFDEISDIESGECSKSIEAETSIMLWLPQATMICKLGLMIQLLTMNGWKTMKKRWDSKEFCKKR